MSTSALTFERVGVVFGIGPDGQHYVEARSDFTLESVLAEINRRYELMLPILRDMPQKPIPVPSTPRIIDRVTKRWGECDACGDPMKPHRGGTCELCNAAIRKCYKTLRGE